MLRTVPLSIIRSFSLCTQQWYMSHRFADSFQTGAGWSILMLLASCQQTCMTYTIAVCTVKNSWWWTEELSETCRVTFQEYTCEISASSWIYYKKLNTMDGHMNVKWINFMTFLGLLYWDSVNKRDREMKQCAFTSFFYFLPQTSLSCEIALLSAVYMSL